MAEQQPPAEPEAYPGQNIQRSLPGVSMMLMIKSMLDKFANTSPDIGGQVMRYLNPKAPAAAAPVTNPLLQRQIPTPRDAQGRPLPIDPATGRPVGQ